MAAPPNKTPIPTTPVAPVALAAPALLVEGDMDPVAPAPPTVVVAETPLVNGTLETEEALVNAGLSVEAVATGCTDVLLGLRTLVGIC